MVSSVGPYLLHFVTYATDYRFTSSPDFFHNALKLLLWLEWVKKRVGNQLFGKKYIGDDPGPKCQPKSTIQKQIHWLTARYF